MMNEPGVSQVAKVLAECAENPFVSVGSERGITDRVLSFFRR
jgi:hypothetical protein